MNHQRSDLLAESTAPDPSPARGVGKATVTSRLRPTPQVVFRVADPDTARSLGESLSRGSVRHLARVADAATEHGRDTSGVAAAAEAAVTHASSTSSGQPLPAGARDRFESSLGADLSAVRVHTGADSADAAHAVGAKAYTVGQDIHFADGRYQPEDPFGMHLLAHEVAHTVQQSGGAARRQHQLEVSGPQDAAEVEAEQAASAMVQGAPASVSGAAPQAARRIHRFNEDAHRDATIDGLSGTFSSQEIGEIYAANWERDFSQAHPKIANVVIGWTAVKNNRSDPAAAAGPFKAAVNDLITTPPKELLDLKGGEAFDGYKTWHHFDQPDDKKVRDKANRRWEGLNNGLAGYICDTKAYIKDQMIAAVDVYREMAGTGAVKDRVSDPWGVKDGNGDEWEIAKPKGYVPTEVTKKDGVVKTQVGPGFDSGVESRDPIRDETERMAKGKDGAKDGQLAKDGRWRLVAQHLGRAMHAFEDFWAHSNWTALAKQQQANPKDGKSQAERNQGLETGVFDTPAQLHSLGHKIVAMSSGLQRDQALVQKAYGRSGPSTKIARVSPDDLPRVARYLPGGDMALQILKASKGAHAFDALDSKGVGYKSEAAGLGTALGILYMMSTRDFSLADLGDDPQVAVIRLAMQKSGLQITGEDIVCNPTLLAALQAKGQRLIDKADEASDEHSHGKMAKDQHEDGKDHEGAFDIAAKANAQVFAPLRKIMDMTDPEAAAKAVEGQLKLVDQMLQAPSPDHPLLAGG